MTVVIVQCRLSSTRLPRKALLPLGGKPVLAWTLDAMKQVPADRYILAVDYESEEELKPIATEYGWDCFAGSGDDVLERFCAAAIWADCVLPNDLILRATADNPFLFYESAIQLLKEIKKHPCDYITFTGIPHGSGVELFNARSLIESCGMTTDPYDHEHVGPALYNHSDNFASVMLPAPAKWNHPEYRTTIDTYNDYRRALRIVRRVSAGRNLRRPYTYEEICSAFSDSSVINPVLCVPCVSKGNGTGHLRRCLDVAYKIGADVYIPQNHNLDVVDELVQEGIQHGLEEWQIIHHLPEPNSYSLVLTDTFMLEKKLARELSAIGSVAAIDEGSTFTAYCDYLLDIIPSAKLIRSANLNNIGFIPLPKNKKDVANSFGSAKALEKVLVSVGGEDPSELSLPAAIAFAELEKNVTLIVNEPNAIRKKIPESLQKNIRIVPPVSNLRERLYMYDIVVTHYGFTAFEAVAAGCGVILLETSSLHGILAQKYGFALVQSELNVAKIESLLNQFDLLFPKEIYDKLSKGSSESLESFVCRMSAGKKMLCPICCTKPVFPDNVVARTPKRTFRRCSSCGMLYMSWSLTAEVQKYSADYFFDDYKKQYGKTYLEDFSAIKTQCVRRMSVIDSIFWSKSKNKARLKKGYSLTPAVLDIGCAMGPFLDAASDAGWQVYGTDVSEDAIEYVQNELRYPAVCASFPEIDTLAEFGISKFDAITMWYVIEHFQQLDSVLQSVSSMLKKGGVFAFSTPSASGVSGKYSPESFFATSPEDHYTLWEPCKVGDILKRYGFKIIRKISTGHHAERFPLAKKLGLKPASFGFSILTGISRCFGLGDTFEVYCVKTDEVKKKRDEK